MWPFRNGKKLETIPGVLGEEEFRRALQRERSRADRTGIPLSLVVVMESRSERARVSSHQGHNAMLPKLARILSHRVRCTDIVGRFGKGKLGLVLPHTPGEGACVLIEDTRTALIDKYGDGGGATRLLYRVYTYPANGSPISEGESSGASLVENVMSPVG